MQGNRADGAPEGASLHQLLPSRQREMRQLQGLRSAGFARKADARTGGRCSGRTVRGRVPPGDSRVSLLSLLQRYRPEDRHQRSTRERFREFVLAHPDCFGRSLLIGHVTGSAWVVDSIRRHALLTHHRKLGKWLQLGGHTDGESDVLSAALREVREEAGIDEIRPAQDGIFDLDIHTIPRNGDVPEHLHYDVRFLVEANRAQPLRPSDESHEVKWLPLPGIEEWTREESVLRMVRKTCRRAAVAAVKPSSIL